MKKLDICYHMSRRHGDGVHTEDVETRIIIPMINEWADDIFEKQCDSSYVNKYTGERNVYDALLNLAVIQGYADVEFYCAMRVEEDAT
jgi:hypothetical protein